MFNRSRFLVLAIISLFITSATINTLAQTVKPKAIPPSALANSLPASDAVMVLNAKKFIDTALPEILGADSPKLAQINAQIAAVKEKTGIDLREFEQAAAGIKYKHISATEIDFEPVIVANGQFNAAAKIALVKIAVNGKYREEKVGEKTYFVLPVNDIFADITKGQRGSSVEKMMEKVLRTFSGEIAVAALNEKTLVVGSPARVSETLGATTSISAEMASFANAKPGAVVTFGGKTPAGLSKMFGLDNEEIAKMLDSVRTVSGHLDMTATGASLLLAAKTNSVGEATEIEGTMTGLKELGKVLVSTVKGEERDTYSRLIDAASITRVGNQVKINLLIPQSDLKILGKKL